MILPHCQVEFCVFSGVCCWNVTRNFHLFQNKFNDKTPYTIMFGPDKCGNDFKVSAISDFSYFHSIILCWRCDDVVIGFLLCNWKVVTSEFESYP